MIRTGKAAGEQPLPSAFALDLEDHIWNYCIWVWPSHCREDVEKLEQVLQRPPRGSLGLARKLRKPFCWPGGEKEALIPASHFLMAVRGRLEPGSPSSQWKFLASFQGYLSSILMMITVL